ncbi:MAG: type I DNA topoisomerase [Patescibacteria group bacterium]
MRLVIVESPTKAKTISRFLGSDFVVTSSFGHIRDLPKGELGVDVEKNFEPSYIIPTKAKKNVTALKKEAAKADEILLATDPDREGEAISWHLAQVLGLGKKSAKKKDPIKKVERVVFHEITKHAIEEAIAHPRTLDQNLVDAQQARRVLDRLVGYKLSPILWKRYYRGLSAGRVQSVAVRLIVDREREIEKFVPEEYWTIGALVAPKKSDKSFLSELIKIGDKTLEKLSIKNKAESDEIVSALEGASWKVASVDRKEVARSPFSPFTTSTLQQDAAKKLRYSSKQTMMFAQRLYEAGYITYMRTDSVNLSTESIAAVKSYITETLGEKYFEARVFTKKSKNAQEAHEAIRPTDPTRTPEQMAKELEPQQARLYELIWRRFVASQMPKAIFDAAAIDIEASKYTFRANGSTLKFDGFLKIYPVKFEETELPIVEVGQELDLKELKPEQHATKPPARFNEASLIKTLEKEGIGRPSTYASIISTIQTRRYVEKDRSRYFHPTEIGKLVNDYLVEHFPKIVDIAFTSHMEDELDDIANGKIEWAPVVREFYEPLEVQLASRMEEAKAQKKAEETETTDKICDKCGNPMIVKRGRFGKFIACSNFPTCKNVLKEAKPAMPVEKTGEKCDKCGTGDLIIRVGRFGRFIACSNFPKCKNTRKLTKEEAA